MSTSTTADPTLPSDLPDGTARRRTGAVLVGLGTVGFAATYLLAVLTEAGQRVDNAVMEALTVTGEQHDRLAAALPNPYLLLLGCGLLALVAAVHRLRTGAAVAVSVAVLVVSIQLLKALLPRPQLADPWVMANSLPSGHTGAAAALAVALLLVSPRLLLPLAAVVGTAVTAYMGVLVVMLGYHRPSDVLAAVLVAVASLGLGLLLRDPAPGPATRTAPR